MNYEFVSSNSYSSAQIFAYLPTVLEYPFTDSSGNVKREEIYRLFGRDVSDSDMELFNSVSVLGLVPYTDSSKSYVVTLADVVFPKKYVDQLSSLLQDTTSRLYSNPSKIAEQLASQIDPTIPLNILINIATGLTESSSSSSSSSSNGLGTLGGSTTSSYLKKSYSSFLKDKKTRVAFFVCLALGCALYIVIMVLICKKFLSYMKKKYPARVIEVPVEGSFIVDPFEEFSYRSSMMSNAAKEGKMYSDMLFKRGSMIQSKSDVKSEANEKAASSVSSASISSFTDPETVSIKKAKLASEKSRLSKLYVYEENTDDIYADQISMTPSVKIDRWMDFNASEVLNIANLVDNTQSHRYAKHATNTLNSDSSNSYTGSSSSNRQLLAQYLGRKQPPLPPPNWKEIMGTMNSSLQNNKGSTLNMSEMNSSDAAKRTFDETDTFGWNRKEE